MHWILPHCLHFLILRILCREAGKIKHNSQGRIQDFKLGGGGAGAQLKKLHRAEGGAKIVGVFRVKNNDFMPKNHIFSNFRRGGGGGHTLGAPPWIRP